MGLHQTNVQHRKGNINKMKRQPTGWENIFSNDTAGNGWLNIQNLERTYKTQHYKKLNNPI